MARYKPVFTPQSRAVLSRVFKDAWARGRHEEPDARRMRFNPKRAKPGRTRAIVERMNPIKRGLPKIIPVLGVLGLAYWLSKRK